MLKNFETREELIDNLDLIFPNGKGVELGVFRGEFSKKILSSWSGTLYMIDVWRPLGDEYIDASNNIQNKDAYFYAMESTKGFEDKGIMIRAESKIASEMFQDESLDFIYIDANHTYEFVTEDMSLWFPKLKKNGVFSGHDYMGLDWYNDPNFLPNGKDKHIYTTTYEGNVFYNGIFGVNPAVDEFCKKHNYIPNIIKGWFGTWWFIK